MRRHRTIILTALLLYVVAAVVLLYSSYCMFTRLKMQINDYGTYVNFIWNTAHGQPFRYLMDDNYLRTHLSLTLALLSPLFLVWDHPFLLAVVQWLCGVGGSLWMAHLACRRRFPPELVAALLFFFLAYASMQSVLLCDFHGVCLYFVLFPWLYNELSKKRLLSLAPLALIMGLREDAAFLVVPMILYFAVTQRWRAGYLFAAVALLYGIIAVQWIFPWVNCVTIWDRRSDLVDGDKMVDSLSWEGMTNRGVALFWLFLPAFPLMTRRTALPIVLFPLAALSIVMVSPHLYNHALDKQYPAPAFTLMVLGMIETLGARSSGAAMNTSFHRMAVYLIAVTVVAHFGMGHLPIGHQNKTRDLMMPRSPYGLTALHAASLLPKNGVLLTTAQLSGICANRRDLLLFGRLNGRADKVDIVFAGWTRLFAEEGQEWIARLQSGEFGATYFDHNYAILTRGATSDLSKELLLARDNLSRTILFPKTHSHQGDTAYTRNWEKTRHWHGNGSRAPANLTYKSFVLLDAGRYTAIFRLRANVPRRVVRGNWGFLELYSLGGAEALVSSEIDHAAAADDEFILQKLTFSIREPTQVEPRVTAGDAELWLDRVIFVPQGE